MANAIDLGGSDLYVNAIYTGTTQPGNLSNTVASGAQNINATAATLTLTAAQSGSTITFNRAAGTTVTLPTPVAGLTYRFIIGTVATSNAQKVITPASVFIAGGLDIDKALTITRYAGDTTTIRSINLNGTTTGGGTIGDTFTVIGVSATQYTVSGTVTASSTLATPFATS